MTLLSQEVQQLFGIARTAGGLVSDHVGKVLNAVQILRGLVDLVADANQAKHLIRIEDGRICRDEVIS